MLHIRSLLKVQDIHKGIGWHVLETEIEIEVRYSTKRVKCKYGNLYLKYLILKIHQSCTPIA